MSFVITAENDWWYTVQATLSGNAAQTFTFSTCSYVW